MQSFIRLLAVMMLAATIPLASVSAADELQWRRPEPAGTGASRPSASSELRFQRPPPSDGRQQPAPHAGVRPATFEDEASGLKWTDGPAILRSVVVDRHDDTRPDPPPIRSAQLPTDDPPQPPPFDDQLDLDPLALPDDQPLEFDDTLRSPADRPQPDAPGPQAPDTFPQPAADDRAPVTPDPWQVEDLPGVEPEILEAEREHVERVCAEALAELRASTLRDVDISIAVTGVEGEDFPFECTIDDGAWHPGRFWHKTVFMWKASALCHKPLYFENASLERYGHSWGPFVQPLVSGAHFFSRLPVLPYCMGVEPPHECIYALGHYRPGSCAPYLIDPVPISARGAAFQAAATTGAVFVIP